jgi:hypothetical protein
MAASFSRRVGRTGGRHNLPGTLRITKAHLAGFEEGLIENDKQEFPADVDPGMKQVIHDAIASEIETLREQIDHYEQLHDGHITGREITSLHELPTAYCAGARPRSGVRPLR